VSRGTGPLDGQARSVSKERRTALLTGIVLLGMGAAAIAAVLADRFPGLRNHR